MSSNQMSTLRLQTQKNEIITRRHFADCTYSYFQQFSSVGLNFLCAFDYVWVCIHTRISLRYQKLFRNVEYYPSSRKIRLEGSYIYTTANIYRSESGQKGHSSGGLFSSDTSPLQFYMSNQEIYLFVIFQEKHSWETGFLQRNL